MAGTAKQLGAKQLQAAASLALGSVPEAAKACGVPERTLYRWMQREDFREEVRRRQRESLSRVAARLHGILSRSLDKLEAIANDPDAPPSARVRAIRVALDGVMRFGELELVTERIAKVEEIARAGQV